MESAQCQKVVPVISAPFLLGHLPSWSLGQYQQLPVARNSEWEIKIGGCNKVHDSITFCHVN